MHFYQLAPLHRLRSILLLLTLLFAFKATAQQQVKGQIFDAATREPIPYATILADTMAATGTEANTQGHFSIYLPAGRPYLVISSVGYQRKTLLLTSEDTNLEIYLQPSKTTLAEVTVHAGENPALRIIRQAIRRRRQHQLEQLAAYQFTAYQKTFMTLDPAQVQALDPEATDTTEAAKARRIQSYTAQSHLFMAEDVTERLYVSPGQIQDKVIASRFSGIKSPMAALLTGMFKPFEFYSNTIPVLDKEYSSPLSDNAWRTYDFTLADTLYAQKDTVWVLHYEPRTAAGLPTLKGILHIREPDFALVYASASPAIQGMIGFDIEQQWDKLEGRYWFPVHLGVTLHFYKLKVNTINMVAVSESHLQHIRINPPIERQALRGPQVQVAPNAIYQPEQVWNRYRTDSLTAREQRTYIQTDSIMARAKSQRSLKILEWMMLGKVPGKWLDLDLNRVFTFNAWEGYRLGAGFTSSPRLFNNAMLGAYVAYGTRDRAIKWGANATYAFGTARTPLLSASFINDVQEPGQTQWLFAPATSSLSGTTYRSLMGNRMDRVQAARMQIEWETFPNLRMSGAILRQDLQALYGYTYLTNTENAAATSQFSITEATLELNYTKGLRITNLGGYMIQTGAALPVLKIQVGRGLSLGTHGEYTYNTLRFLTHHRWSIPGAGRIELQTTGGITRDNLPYPLLFTGRGTLQSSWLQADGYFQTMGLYEFTSSQHADAQLRWHLGRIASLSPKISPELALVQHSGIGWLFNKEIHQGIEIQSMERGYHESGLELANLYRFNYANVAYLGLGGGIYYRYGPYSNPLPKDNLAFRLGIQLSL